MPDIIIKIKIHGDIAYRMAKSIITQMTIPMVLRFMIFSCLLIIRVLCLFIVLRGLFSVHTFCRRGCVQINIPALEPPLIKGLKTSCDQGDCSPFTCTLRQILSNPCKIGKNCI